MESAILLKNSGLKVTKQREEILSILINANCELTADDIYLSLKKEGFEFGFSTVYRTLSLLQKHKILEKTDFPDSDKQYYSMVSNNHQHKLICIRCKRCVRIDGCPVEKFTTDACEKSGFTLTGHSFEIFGICPECK